MSLSIGNSARATLPTPQPPTPSLSLSPLTLAGGGGGGGGGGPTLRGKWVPLAPLFDLVRHPPHLHTMPQSAN